MSRAAASASDESAPETDADILSELLERTAYMVSAWAEIRREGDLNMVALSIKGPWPELEWRRREEANIPHGHTDIISWANDRVVNQWRLNPRGVKVDPTGGEATKKTAEMRESRIREIAYSSQAKGARICCFQNMVDRGYGAWEIYADYESPTSSRQKLCVGRIPNPNSVLVDPDTTKADRSDKKYTVKMGQTMSVAAFKRKYPQSRDIASFPAETLGLASHYCSPDGKTVTPAEYFRIVTTKDMVLTLDTGEDVLKSKATPEQQARAVKTRETELPRVEKFLTNGLQILSRDVLPISVIPILFGVAKEKYVDDKLTVEALTSKQREPQLNFDVARAAQMQAVNMVPKSKWVVSDEQILGYEDQWDNAHVNPSARLMVHEYDRQGRQMAHPERTDYEPPIDGFVLSAREFLNDSQTAVGMTSTDRVARVAKSGVAQERINEAGDISAFHITDNMSMLIEFEGRIENEWLSKIEDSERTVGLRKPDGKYVTAKISPKTDDAGNVMHDYGKAEDHAITFSTGPDYASQKDEKVAQLETLIKTPDVIANPLLPMLIHEMELGPGGDKMEKIALSVQPPAVQAAYAEEDGEDGQEPMSPQAIQAIQKAQGELQALNAHSKQLETQVIELSDDIKGQKVQADSRERIAQQDNATKVKLQAMKDATDINLKRFDVELERIALDRERFKGSIALSSKTADIDSKERMQNAQLEHASQSAEEERQHESRTIVDG